MCGALLPSKCPQFYLGRIILLQATMYHYGARLLRLDGPNALSGEANSFLLSEVFAFDTC